LRPFSNEISREEALSISRVGSLSRGVALDKRNRYFSRLFPSRKFLSAILSRRERRECISWRCADRVSNQGRFRPSAPKTGEIGGERLRQTRQVTLVARRRRRRRESGSRNRIMSRQDIPLALPRDDRLARHRKDISRQKRPGGREGGREGL